jgi:hypothetical protein
LRDRGGRFRKSRAALSLVAALRLSEGEGEESVGHADAPLTGLGDVPGGSCTNNCRPEEKTLLSNCTIRRKEYIFPYRKNLRVALRPRYRPLSVSTVFQIFSGLRPERVPSPHLAVGSGRAV